MATLTEFGKELRKLRIDKDERLLDMARHLGRSVAFVSAVEVGKKAPPAGFEDEIIHAYGITGALAKKLRGAADRVRRTFVVVPDSELGRDTAGMFARRINSLSPEQLEAINRLLQGGSDTQGGSKEDERG